MPVVRGKQTIATPPVTTIEASSNNREDIIRRRNGMIASIRHLADLDQAYGPGRGLRSQPDWPRRRTIQQIAKADERMLAKRFRRRRRAAVRFGEDQRDP
jgi:hypothetical protein